ncbi:TraB/GumN family protein [Phenylobacterium sp. LjRoot219]|uniref:TraB/GumN family protein n=1 Tax=Phenylobacterium sp. LjRoot219 TaxID=3342283 RepID=UPI003ECD1884
MRRFRWAALAVAVLAGWFAATAASAAPALWLVKHGRSEIYLFGTLHALPRGAAWRTPAYDAAYARAQTVWFEAPVDEVDPAAFSGFVARHGVDPARPLSRKLPPRTLAELERQADLRQVDHLRPWAAALMLSMLPPPGPRTPDGPTVAAGADLMLIRAARQDGKAVRTFETLEDQAWIFAGLSERAELRYLTDVIRERTPRRGPSWLRKPSPEGLVAAWLEGDLSRTGAGFVGPMKNGNPALYEALLRRRNLAWAEALAQEMASGSGVELVNVGALHMVGDDGLPALMKARGFEVLRVQ